MSQGANGTRNKELNEYNAVPGSGFANSEVSYALEFTPWAEWLGMEIDPASLAEFGEEGVIAHCLWAMTFVDFDETLIQTFRDDLMAKVDEIKRMRDEEG